MKAKHWTKKLFKSSSSSSKASPTPIDTRSYSSTAYIPPPPSCSLPSPISPDIAGKKHGPSRQVFHFSNGNGSVQSLLSLAYSSGGGQDLAKQPSMMHCTHDSVPPSPIIAAIGTPRLYNSTINDSATASEDGKPETTTLYYYPPPPSPSMSMIEDRQNKRKEGVSKQELQCRRNAAMIGQLPDARFSDPEIALSSPYYSHHTAPSKQADTFPSSSTNSGRQNSNLVSKSIGPSNPFRCDTSRARSGSMPSSPPPAYWIPPKPRPHEIASLPEQYVQYLQLQQEHQKAQLQIHQQLQLYHQYQQQRQQQQQQQQQQEIISASAHDHSPHARAPSPAPAPLEKTGGGESAATSGWVQYSSETIRKLKASMTVLAKTASSPLTRSNNSGRQPLTSSNIPFCPTNTPVVSGSIDPVLRSSPVTNSAPSPMHMQTIFTQPMGSQAQRGPEGPSYEQLVKVVDTLSGTVEDLSRKIVMMMGVAGNTNLQQQLHSLQPIQEEDSEGGLSPTTPLSLMRHFLPMTSHVDSPSSMSSIRFSTERSSRRPSNASIVGQTPQPRSPHISSTPSDTGYAPYLVVSEVGQKTHRNPSSKTNCCPRVSRRPVLLPPPPPLQSLPETPDMMNTSSSTSTLLSSTFSTSSLDSPLLLQPPSCPASLPPVFLTPSISTAALTTKSPAPKPSSPLHATEELLPPVPAPAPVPAPLRPPKLPRSESLSPSSPEEVGESEERLFSRNESLFTCPGPVLMPASETTRVNDKEEKQVPVVPQRRHPGGDSITDNSSIRSTQRITNKITVCTGPINVISRSRSAGFDMTTAASRSFSSTSTKIRLEARSRKRHHHFSKEVALSWSSPVILCSSSSLASSPSSNSISPSSKTAPIIVTNSSAGAKITESLSAKTDLSTSAHLMLNEGSSKSAPLLGTRLVTSAVELSTTAQAGRPSRPVRSGSDDMCPTLAAIDDKLAILQFEWPELFSEDGVRTEKDDSMETEDAREGEQSEEVEEGKENGGKAEYQKSMNRRSMLCLDDELQAMVGQLQQELINKRDWYQRAAAMAVHVDMAGGAAVNGNRSRSGSGVSQESTPSQRAKMMTSDRLRQVRGKDVSSDNEDLTKVCGPETRQLLNEIEQIRVRVLQWGQNHRSP